MTRSIMEMTDEILNGALSETGSSVQKDEPELPELSDEQRASMLNESLATESVSTYPRITLKKEQLDPSKPHQPTDANAAARAAQKAKSQQRRKVQSQAHSRYPRTNADSNSGPDSAHQKGRGKRAGEAGHVDTRSQGSSSGSNSATWRKELSKAKDPAKHGTSQTIIPGKGGQKFARDAHAKALQRSRDKGKSGITKLQSANLSRKQHAVLKEALSILREVTSVGGIGMGGSANKCYDADAKPMGKDTPPIKGVDASLKKMTKKGSKKVPKKTSKKDKKEMENSSFSRFLDGIVNETLES